MPYNPNAPTGGDVTLVFHLAWAGLIASIALLASYVLGFGPVISAFALAITGACIFVLMFENRLDEHFNSLRDIGLRWGMSVIALYLFAGAIFSLSSGAHTLGFLPAAGELPDPRHRLTGFFADGYLLAILAGLAFHLGFAFARIRGAPGK